MVAHNPADQVRLKHALSSRPDYYKVLGSAYISNPFLQLSDDESEYIVNRLAPLPLRALVMAREAVRHSTAPKICVFCMPKSGSSFVRAALDQALGLRQVSLTSFASGTVSSKLGANSREQEIDELALIKAIAVHPDGFTAQHHTRYSRYLGLQGRFYGLTPIVTVRSIADCIVSFDDMMVKWRGNTSARAPWLSDPQFALPVDYPALDPAARYGLLAQSFGPWLIGFYLSWKRGGADGQIPPLVLRYETDIRDPEVFVERTAAALGLDSDQRSRLAGFATAPDRAAARFNVGRPGRGRELIPEAVLDGLAAHLALFRREIPEDEAAYLLG